MTGSSSSSICDRNGHDGPASSRLENGECDEYSPLIPPAMSSSESTVPGNESAEVVLSRARRMLYVSHLFAQFSEIAWQFCLILFLAAFSNYKSLILVSTYGFTSYLSVCIFGSAAGRFVDGSDRLFVAQRFIWTENIAVLVATSFCYILLTRGNQHDDTQSLYHDSSSSNRFQGIPTDPLSIILLVGIHVLGATAQILDKGFLVAMERDWIVVMSRYPLNRVDLTQQDQVNIQKKWLSETNVAMKQIDLSCKVAAPSVAGYFIAVLDDGSDPHHGNDLRGAALLVGALNGMALIVEYICTKIIYSQIPDLAIRASSRDTRAMAENDVQDQKEESNSSETPRAVTKKGPVATCFSRLPDGLRIYLSQSISWAGIGLSLLYLNVLTFGGIMTAYLVWRGMRLEAIGVWRGLSSAVGLAGTFVYHISSQNMSLESTGMWSVVFQFTCLSLSYASLFVDDYDTSMTMLIAGVCASRVGLWVFDISVTQLMQDYVPDGVRGLVGGVQQSMNAFFFLLSFAIGIVLPDPRDFPIYVAAGYAGVGLAVPCFYFGVFRNRGKLGPHAITLE